MLAQLGTEIVKRWRQEHDRIFFAWLLGKRLYNSRVHGRGADDPNS